MQIRKIQTILAAVLCASLILTSCSTGRTEETTQEITTTTPANTTTAEQTTGSEETTAEETTLDTAEDTTEDTTAGTGMDPDTGIASDFTVYDREGNPKKLSDLRGKPVVINFWATWCHYCVEEMPQFEEAYKKYGDSVEFMLIDLTDGYQETQEWGEEFIDNKKITAPVYFDLDQDAAVAHSVYSIPVTYLIYSDGRVYDCTIGQIGETYLDDNIPNLD